MYSKTLAKLHLVNVLLVLLQNARINLKVGFCPRTFQHIGWFPSASLFVQLSRQLSDLGLHCMDPQPHPKKSPLCSGITSIMYSFKKICFCCLKDIKSNLETEIFLLRSYILIPSMIAGFLFSKHAVCITFSSNYYSGKRTVAAYPLSQRAWFSVK